MAVDSILPGAFALALYFSSDLALALSDRLKLPPNRWVRGGLQYAIFSILMLSAILVLLAVVYFGMLAWAAIK